MKVILLVAALAAVAQAVPNPQNWPYRDNFEYYGYPQRGNFYRNVGGSAEDDEVEVGRQDLKVGGQSSQDVAGAAGTAVVGDANVQPVVVETGSAKPVASAATADTKQASAPAVNKPTNNASPGQPPAFPPATPKPPAAKPEESEEDSDEEDEEADEDDNDEEQDEEESEEFDSRRRNEPINVVEPVANVTSVQETDGAVKKTSSNVQTVEALVPGYVTSQGEVLVPFDTVANRENNNVDVVEDPNYVKNSPPVVVMKEQVDEKPVDPATRTIPKFFNPWANKQVYYSEVPPPGSIFTFDDDNDVADHSQAPQAINWEKRGRQDRSSEEEDDTGDDDDSAQDDDSASEEERAERPRPPLSHIKATAPSGEDDEAESLGIRLARMAYDPRYYDFVQSRSPNYFYAGNGYYVTRYPVRDYEERPQYYYKPQYSRYPVEPIYYYRPASDERVKVVPIGSFDVSMETDGEDYFKPVVSPIRPHNRRPVQGQVVRRPQPQPQSSGVVRRRPQVSGNSKPVPVVIRRPGNYKPSILAIYNVEGGTPVSHRGRTSGRLTRISRREAKDLKNKKKQKKILQDVQKKKNEGMKKMKL